jgi:ribose/xylose/arabinose/galactoside ABC-type transport system permease subunit
VLILWHVWLPHSVKGEPMFLTPSLLTTIFYERAIYGFLAAGMTLVIITGGIDLAVGSVLALTATSFAIFLIWWKWSPGWAILATLAVGAAAGSVSGALVARLRMQPFAATLAMMVFARGVARLISENQKVQTADSPPIFATFSDPLGPPGSPALLSILFVLCFVALALVMVKTRFGRSLYAIGGNEEAARLSGLLVARITWLAYVVCGVTAALGGICDASRQTMGDPSSGVAYELDAIAAVVIGGTSLMGGQGGITLTFVGVLVVGLIDKLLSLHGWDESMRLMAKGVIIVFAVLIQQIGRRRT